MWVKDKQYSIDNFSQCESVTFLSVSLTRPCKVRKAGI